MNSEDIKLDSDENTTNLDNEGGDSYKFISKQWKQKGASVFILNKLSQMLPGAKFPCTSLQNEVDLTAHISW